MLVPMLVLADVGTLYDKADSLYNAQQYDEAQKLALDALAQCKDSADVADCTSLLALIHVRQGQFGEAVKYAKRCNAIDLESGDPDNIASSLNTLAGIYMSMRQPEEAEKYILKAISYAQKADNPQRMAVLHGMASEVYYKLQQEEKSLEYATKAYQMEQQLGRKDKMAIRQAERAAALIGLKRYDEASKALAEAIPGLRESGNIHSLGIACNQMGDMMHEALRHTDPDLAMQHNDRYLALRDSLYDKDTGELLSKYAAEYGNNELQAENLEMQKTNRLYIIIGVVMLLVAIVAGIALYLWMKWREQQHTEQLIHKIQELSAALEAGEQAQPTTASEETQESETESEEETEDQLFLMRVVKAVNDGLPTGHYGVDEIASALNMGTQTFRRRLMKVTGDSPKAFISAIQMERAAKLLTMSPDMPISQIAMRCGYEETTSFTRAFRKAFGVPPSQYKA